MVNTESVRRRKIRAARLGRVKENPGSLGGRKIRPAPGGELQSVQRGWGVCRKIRAAPGRGVEENPCSPGGELQSVQPGWGV